MASNPSVSAGEAVTLAPDPVRAPSPDLSEFYRRAMAVLREGEVPFMIGGSWAFAWYTGISRPSHDFDLFIRRGDYERATHLMREAGFRTELLYPHWLGKVFDGDDFIDLIFAGGNGEAPVDDGWFEHAEPVVAFGMDCLAVPVEETIWSKSFLMERERFDGADIIHLILEKGPELDWERLVLRFASHWRLLLAHLVLFGFVYPGHRTRVPREVMNMLTERLARENEQEPDPTLERLCQGTLISRAQYLADVEARGYADARLKPRGKMNEGQIGRWTAAIEEENTV